MAEKVGGGGKLRHYDESNGEYIKEGASKEDLRIFLPSKEKYTEIKLDNKTEKQPKKHYSKHIDSLVMDKYSTVIDKVQRKGFATVVVNDYKKSYVIIIKKSENDFEYDIIREFDIDN